VHHADDVEVGVIGRAFGAQMISRVDGVELGGGREVAAGVEGGRACLAVDVGPCEQSAGFEGVLANGEVDDLVEGLSTHAEHEGTISKGVSEASVA
jgi:hypothetical protein